MAATTFRNCDSRRTRVIALLALMAVPRLGMAQCAVPRAPAWKLGIVGDAADDSSRLGALTGACWGNSSLIYAPSTSEPAVVPGRIAWSVLDPILTTVWNSRIPESMNDGAMWAGRGWNQSVTGGARGSLGRLRLVVAPILIVSQNRPFGIIPSGAAGFSNFASPFHAVGPSADLPLRFGARPLTIVDLGETSLSLTSRYLEGGLSASSQWWGPGIRNALLMSNNAPGIPRAFLRTARPLRTIVGDVEGYWFLGALTESPYFDRDASNDMRAINAAVVTLRLAADTGLTIGVTRSIYSAVPRIGGLPGHAADVFIDWGRSGATNPDGTDRDQLMSLFAQWRVPASGLAAHAEWSRMSLPASLRDLFVQPQQRQGFTVGIQWANQIAPRSMLRFQGEATMLEQTPPRAGVEVTDFYASRQVGQGYTQRGQVIGAAIGPGSSSQYLGLDWFHGPMQLGMSVGRIRWEEGAYYRSPAALSHYGHDVSMFGALRGRWDLHWMAIDARITRTKRYSYLFQTFDPYAVTDESFDLSNTTLYVQLTPRTIR